MSEPSELLVATNNAGKVRELSQLLADLRLRLRFLSEFEDIPEAEETGATFAENATLKALHYSARAELLTLSDDSGLEVDALGGAPGVYSARYAGASATYDERMAKLLDELATTGDGARRARFVCVIALADPSTGVVETFEVACNPNVKRCYGFTYREDDALAYATVAETDEVNSPKMAVKAFVASRL